MMNECVVPFSRRVGILAAASRDELFLYNALQTEEVYSASEEFILIMIMHVQNVVSPTSCSNAQ